MIHRVNHYEHLCCAEMNAGELEDNFSHERSLHKIKSSQVGMRKGEW